MPKTFNDLESARPLLDIASYARRGPGQRDRLSPGEIQLIARTVRRTPEVMVKVLSRGGQDMKSVGRHLSYLSRKGDLAIETDQGEEIRGRDAEAALLEDWDLDIQEQRPTSLLGPGLNRKSPKLVHKLLFSMPPGTPPKKVLEAVKLFAREEFGLTYRYAMVLHTDEPHPHVHMVVKAVTESGVRLNIRRATLRNWRSEFARRLRQYGVEANATERAVRGQNSSPKSDSIFRAIQRGTSTHMDERLIMAVGAFGEARVRSELGRDALRRTRAAVECGWRAVGEILANQGKAEVAQEVRRFALKFRPIRTDHEELEQRLRARQEATEPRAERERR